MMKMGRSHNTKEKNRQYDAVYHFRNREVRKSESKRRANSEEQKLYRRLYARWRFALQGNKVNKKESFDKPDKSTRLLILKKREFGCSVCGKHKELQLDHADGHPNNNSLKNLQWLCEYCHKLKTEKERLKGIYSKYETLAKRKPWAKR